MKNQNQTASGQIYDGRGIPCSVKHGQIIGRWLGLRVGESFVLVNDHDPERMREQFAAEWPGAFAWEHLQKDAEEVRVKITKLKPVDALGREIGLKNACGCEH